MQVMLFLPFQSFQSLNLSGERFGHVTIICEFTQNSFPQSETSRSKKGPGRGKVRGVENCSPTLKV